MDLDFDEAQYEVQREARRFLEEQCPPAHVREHVEDPAGWSRGLWKQMADLGWTAMPFPEEHGGLGMGYLDVVLLVGELGRVVAPVPYLSSIAVCGVAIDRTGSDEQRGRLLPELASGQRIAALVSPDEGDLGDARIEAAPEGSGWRIRGSKPAVFDAPAADRFLVGAQVDGSRRLFVVDDGFEVTPQTGFDLTRPIGEVRFDDAPAELLEGDPEAALRLAVASACAELIGVAGKVLDLTVAYSKDRVQFDRPIGSFQAIKHRCAEMATLLDASRAATYYACWAADAGAEDAQLAVSSAKSYVSDACGWIAGEGIQVHGGIAYTWEHDMHLYARRIKSLQAAFGDAHRHREVVAEIAGL
jgi:alkylation response protein AidB-like acyl-CoA dehydrogenase